MVAVEVMSFYAVTSWASRYGGIAFGSEAGEDKDKEDGKRVERRSLCISRPNLQALMRERYSTTYLSCVREGKPCVSKGMYLIVAQP
jgi:hypothetical protein